MVEFVLVIVLFVALEILLFDDCNFVDCGFKVEFVLCKFFRIYIRFF